MVLQGNFLMTGRMHQIYIHYIPWIGHLFFQDTEIITPFKVAAVMSKNGIGQSPKKQNADLEGRSDFVTAKGEVSCDSQVTGLNDNVASKQKTGPQKDISASESFLRMEDYKRQTEVLLERFKNSHFFVKIAELGEPLCALIDRGNFDTNVSGGTTRNGVSCCSLSKGDIVVHLRVNVGVHFFRDLIIEILQFEKYQERNWFPENQENLNCGNYDPCRELLKWLLPVDNTLSSTVRSLPPPQLSSYSGFGGASQKSSSSGSQLFSHFRSYSMSSLPQNSAPPPQPVKAQSSKPSFDFENWDQYSSQKLWKSRKHEERLSFRGRRWWRKLEIIQPAEIHSFAAYCNTDDLLCVQIKNISPERIPDIVVDIDTITTVFEEASKSGLPTSLPIACIEAGNDQSLPDLALSLLFILGFQGSQRKAIPSPPSRGLHLVPNTMEGRSALNADLYAIMISCRCNYTGIITGEKYGSAVQALSSVTTTSENMKWNSDGGVQSVSFIEQSSPISDVISSTGLGCTHLWLRCRVPLGCVSVHSTTTIKLELLPLTDGIISLNTFR
ncbi:hypothetical protein POTOM_032264 [Populus tomentosa]|uniref:Uncharacterized protein n=1 Tax=Populus tomentosa TaxID=118781 RepID=A0A8X7ZE46_POPTO|nr:hypothetical protein POTOM_032264 [Populus tomentosa]